MQLEEGGREILTLTLTLTLTLALTRTLTLTLTLPLTKVLELVTAIVGGFGFAHAVHGLAA